MKSNLEFDKEDLETMLNERLWRKGMQLPEGRKFDWRFRPVLHVLATVEDMQMSPDEEANIRKLFISRLRDLMVELQQRQKYGHVIRKLEQAVFQLEHAELDGQNNVAHLPFEDDDIPAMVPVSAKRAASAKPVESDDFASDLDRIIAKSRNLMSGESRVDPRAK